MSRFRKGTTDHDGDGRMGGSLKENDMTKTPTKKPSAKPAEEKKAESEQKFKEADKKGEPTQEEIDEATLGRSIRGY